MTAESPDLHVLTMGHGPPVVLIHGLLLGSVAQWYFTLGPALSQAHTVVMYDLRGHGRSGVPVRGYDLATLASDLERVRAEQQIRQPMDLVGHSYGGLVALATALAHPHWIRRLVLIDVPLPPGSEAWRTRVEELGVDGLLAMLPDAVRASVLTGGRRGRRLVRRIGHLAQDTTLLQDVAAEPDLEDADLRQLNHPTLCVAGRRSACLPAMERLARVMPAARLVQLDSGHFVPVEAPGPMVTHTTAFLHG